VEKLPQEHGCTHAHKQREREGGRERERERERERDRDRHTHTFREIGDLSTAEITHTQKHCGMTFF
jgi:hypothetical protein